MNVRPFPVLTVLIFALTAVPSALQWPFPHLLTTLQRDPAAVADGEWWRLVTSLVVQDGGWLGTASNLAFLLIVGTLAERSLGRWRWLALYLAGAAAGQAAGLIFDTVGAGNSIAVCGLAGGLLAAFARHRVGRLEAAVATLFTLLVAATAAPASLAAPIVAAVVGGLIVARRAGVPSWLFATVGVVAAAVLSVRANLHGPALAAGLVVGALTAGSIRRPLRSLAA